ncbi:MAG: hypothetical protein E6K92_08495 [Thaumarchaeota archaeon]|nr:MAG: hypothetical protein E6K92_08495 [Nitrososphaerota archaeon]
MSEWIQLAVKLKGKCAECGKEIPQGEHALWSKGSKAIKHVKCEAPAHEKNDRRPEVPELDCFVCGRAAGCAECGFEADCDRQAVSQACICSQCHNVGKLLAEKKAKLDELMKEPELNKNQIAMPSTEIETLQSLFENYNLGMNVFRRAQGGRAGLRE